MLNIDLMNTDYKLLDTGNFKRLELFGDKKIVRSAKQAGWTPSLPEEEWEGADAFFDGEIWKGDIGKFYTFFEKTSFSLSLMSQGQVGIFPEQAENWSWLRDITKDADMNIINGFAYTGGSSIFASHSSTYVTHLDASKPAVKRAQENFHLSGKGDNNVRFINDDVITFLEKEAKRGREYTGFIFDPPAFGRGGRGKRWQIKKDLPKLISLIEKLSGGRPNFVLLSSHEPSMNKKVLSELLQNSFKNIRTEEGDLIMKTDSGQEMKNGYYARFVR